MPQERRSYILASGLLEVESNVKNLPGFLTGLYSVPQADRGRVRLGLTVGRTTTPLDASTAAFGQVSGEPEGEEVHYLAPLGGPMRLRLHLQGLSGSPELQVSPSYYRLVRARLGSILPVGKHLLDVAIVKLLQSHLLPVHAAAVSSRGQGILLAAPPGTGKSLTALRAVERGFSFLSEELAILDGDQVYGLPYTGTFAYSRAAMKGMSGGPSLFRWVHRWLPPLTLYLPVPAVDIRTLAPDAAVEAQAPLAFVFILGQGPKKLEHLDTNDALRRVLLINRNEFSYHDNPVLLGYSYLNPSLDIGALMQREEDILKKALGNSSCFLCQSPSPEGFIDQILEVVGG